MAFEFGSKFKILLPVPLNRGRGSLFVPVLKGLCQKKTFQKIRRIIIGKLQRSHQNMAKVVCFVSPFLVEIPGVLPYMGYIGMRGPQGCGFSAILVKIGSGFCTLVVN